jgi:hypothetical protein
MNFVSATVVQRSGHMDTILLNTDLPNPVYPFNEQMTLRCETPRKQGPDYVRTHFQLEPTVVVE